jgi:hypothetical protein
VFYKHWWGLYDQGRETGLKVLREVLARTRRFYGDRIQWMSCSEIARYYAVSKTYRITQKSSKDSVRVQFETVFPCPGFTISFSAPREVKRFVCGQKELKQVQPGRRRLDPDTWFQEGKTVYACFDLADGASMTVSF